MSGVADSATAELLNDAVSRIIALVDSYRKGEEFRAPETVVNHQAALLVGVIEALDEARAGAGLG